MALIRCCFSYRYNAIEHHQISEIPVMSNHRIGKRPPREFAVRRAIADGEREKQNLKH